MQDAEEIILLESNGWNGADDSPLVAVAAEHMPRIIQSRGLHEADPSISLHMLPCTIRL